MYRPSDEQTNHNQRAFGNRNGVVLGTLNAAPFASDADKRTPPGINYYVLAESERPLTDTGIAVLEQAHGDADAVAPE